MPTTADPEYALSASSDHEHDRLRRQAELYAPFTRRLLQRAGIEPGMRVLDIGCGPGDVSFLVSELVGATGTVVGVEREADAVATARGRAEESGIANVEFVHGDFREVALDDEPFDALVGRLVLMYQADPATALATAARHLRPGGSVAFAEMCLPIGWTAPERSLVCWPRTPVSEQASRWVHDGFARLGTQLDMGLRLPGTFAQAGLAPSPGLETCVANATGDEAIELLVGLIRSMLPGIIATNVATEQEIDIDTLAERLRTDTGQPERVVLWPTVIGACATKAM